MRRLLLSTAALAGSAFAADFPSSKADPVFVPAAPVYSWSGFYVGVCGGGSFASSSVTQIVGATLPR
jgi:outer membrane immunogenic protein